MPSDPERPESGLHSSQQSDRQFVTAYGDGGFQISGTRYSGAVIVLPTRTVAWQPGAFDSLTEDEFEAVVSADPPPEILLLGTGEGIRQVDLRIHRALNTRGIALDVMDTGAACRTYNVLMDEERRVAAALFPV